VEKRITHMIKIEVEFTLEEMLKVLCKAADIPYSAESVKAFVSASNTPILTGITLRSETEDTTTKGDKGNAVS